MRCNNCHEEINDTDRYCGNCGSVIEKETLSFDNQDKLKAKVFGESMDGVLKKTDILSIDYQKEKKNIKKNSFLKSIFPTYVIIAIVILLAFLIIFNKGESEKGKRTLMIYMVGSDLESKYLAGTKDIDEIINSSIDYDDINILIYTGGSKKWHKDDISNDSYGLFEINSKGLVKLEEVERTGTLLEPENLSYFLDYVYKNYKTEYYDLVFWDHGAGPVYGYGYDEYNKKESMTINEIKEALDKSPFMGENKLELIGFDACLMSSIEIASSLSSYANYMVASEEFEPGAGWNYRFLSEVDHNLSSQDFGKLIVDYFEKYYTSKKTVKEYSLSLLKLNKIDNVLKYTNELFEKAVDDLSVDYSMISRTRSNSRSYGRIADDNYYYDLVDLYDLLDNMPDKYSKEVSNLKTALNDLIIYQKTDLINTNGVSIFFPYDNKKDIKNNLKKYNELEFSEPYYIFISSFSEQLTGIKINDWDITRNHISVQDEEKVSIELDENVIKNYSSASYVIFEKKDNNMYTPIFSGSDININGNIMSTNIEKKSLVLTDKDNNKMYLTAIESTKGTDFTSYYIPATITRFNSGSLDFDVEGVYVNFVVDEKNPNGYIANVYPINLNDNKTYSKIEYNLKEWDSITFLSYQYNILDNDGNYTKEWKNSEEVLTLSLSTKEDIKISFDDLDISNNYYCLFKIKDSQGYLYYSNLAKIGD